MRYFIILMEKKNFSKAAEHLCITRSPLSKIITEMEAVLGAKLFIRKRNDLEPTPLAWDMYHKCKPLFDRLSELLDDYNKINARYVSEVFFDITIPENLFKAMSMLLNSDGKNFCCVRQLLSYDEIFKLKDARRKWVVSFRDLGFCAGVYKERWSAGELVLLKSEEKFKDMKKFPPVYIWKEKHTEFLKERFAYALKDVMSSPQFIEHNFDVSTLIYLACSGKGAVLLPHKLARMYKLDGILVVPIKNYSPKCYVYSSNKNSSDPVLKEMKSVLNKLL